MFTEETRTTKTRSSTGTMGNDGLVFSWSILRPVCDNHWRLNTEVSERPASSTQEARELGEETYAYVNQVDFESTETGTTMDSKASNCGCAQVAPGVENCMTLRPILTQQMTTQHPSSECLTTPKSPDHRGHITGRVPLPPFLVSPYPSVTEAFDASTPATAYL